jgi:hypothetical protein
MTVANYLGFDPGGQTGVALLTVGNGLLRCLTDCVDSVDDAIKWSSNKLLDHAPSAAGIDTFLFWETGRCGWRLADLWLKERYIDVQKSVLSSNSVSGSMAVQGMALAILLRRCWPQVELIETHPKVLYRAWSGQKYNWPSNMREWLIARMGLAPETVMSNEHCWDAALSAWAAYKGYTRCWSRDLRTMSDAPLEPAGRCAYWWPESRDRRTLGRFGFSEEARKSLGTRSPCEGGVGLRGEAAKLLSSLWSAWSRAVDAVRVASPARLPCRNHPPLRPHVFI